VSNRLAPKTKSDGELVDSLSNRKAQNFELHSILPNVALTPEKRYDINIVGQQMAQ
jgi:hypothetical protein